jgi:hypothetical protein
VAFQSGVVTRSICRLAAGTGDAVESAADRAGDGPLGEGDPTGATGVAGGAASTHPVRTATRARRRVGTGGAGTGGKATGVGRAGGTR